MTNQFNTYSDKAYKSLQASPRGQQIRETSEASAASFLFALESGDLNADVANVLTPSQIYNGVSLFDSLTFSVDDQEYTVQPYFPVNEENALAILQDIQCRLESEMLQAVIATEQSAEELLPGATAAEVLDVHMPDIIGVYDAAETVPEWAWVAEKACFEHKSNGKELGVYEFVVHTSVDRTGMPPALAPVFELADRESCSYILFNQG